MASLRDLFRRKTIDMILSHAEKHGKDSTTMRRSLTVRDLTALGIAAIVGAGIFSTIGNAAASGGPAISLLFVFTALACGFSAMCYAEFASSIPISGSAYTYAYATFGELIAWIIGWDLIMEYAVGNIAVAISWSGYFVGSSQKLWPRWLGSECEFMRFQSRTMVAHTMKEKKFVCVMVFAPCGSFSNTEYSIAV